MAMNVLEWKAFAKRLTIVDGVPRPVSDRLITICERRLRVSLPASYRAYCKVLGAGRLAKFVEIAVPGGGRDRADDYFNLAKLNQTKPMDYEEYAADPGQVTRSVVFGDSGCRETFFWDPQDITDRRRHEYGIYVRFEDWQTRRLADTFCEFICDVVLGERHREMYIKGPLPHVFEPV